ncbi:hypothetical protein PCANC_19620 [Puccinia coronata f. sp. avenae]|uniref:Uncharacterized protein n=1 Tax=Puccinia coronata f. sp. avenae TaxID=200324 RepID=A0A2N5U0R5_9BASI|nr:hypothetical protein PCANC_19620 [Puccinia coronata f. sp. avenae]
MQWLPLPSLPFTSQGYQRPHNATLQNVDGISSGQDHWLYNYSLPPSNSHSFQPSKLSSDHPWSASLVSSFTPPSYPQQHSQSPLNLQHLPLINQSVVSGTAAPTQATNRTQLPPLIDLQQYQSSSIPPTGLQQQQQPPFLSNQTHHYFHSTAQLFCLPAHQITKLRTIAINSAKHLWMTEDMKEEINELYSEFQRNLNKIAIKNRTSPHLYWAHIGY